MNDDDWFRPWCKECADESRIRGWSRWPLIVHAAYAEIVGPWGLVGNHRPMKHDNDNRA